MNTLVIIRTDGRITEEPIKEPDEDGAPSLERLQEVVGGYIEHIQVMYDGKLRDAYINEEGKLQDPMLPLNRTATRLWWMAHGIQHPSEARDVLVGPVAIVVKS